MGPGTSPPACLRPGNIVFDSADPQRLADFWAAVTGYERRDLFDPYVGLKDPAGVGANLTFQRVEQPPAPGNERCHIDLYVADPDDAARRAEASGATRLATLHEGDTHWIVLADPDGNRFCLVAAIGAERNR